MYIIIVMHLLFSQNSLMLNKFCFREYYPRTKSHLKINEKYSNIFMLNKRKIKHKNIRISSLIVWYFLVIIIHLKTIIKHKIQK